MAQNGSTYVKTPCVPAWSKRLTIGCGKESLSHWGFSRSIAGRGHRPRLQRRRENGVSRKKVHDPAGVTEVARDSATVSSGLTDPGYNSAASIRANSTLLC